MPIAGVVASQLTILVVPPLLTITGTQFYTAQIQNRDTRPAILYENVNQNPPTTARGGGLVNFGVTVSGDKINKLDGGTFYARAFVSPFYSAIVSLTIDSSW